jgi:putative endonuclease
MHYVYLIECLDGFIYTGMTQNPFRRLEEHKTGNRGANFTRKHGVSGVIHIEKYSTKQEAYKREWEIKLWNHQSKIALASGCLTTPSLSLRKRSYLPKINIFVRPKNLMSEANKEIFKRVLAA